MKNLYFVDYGFTGAIRQPPPIMDFLTHHEGIEINCVFRGSMVYLHQWRRRRLEAGQVLAFWGAVPHTVLDCSPDCEMAWIQVPLAWLSAWQLPAEFIRHLLEGEWWLDAEESDLASREIIRRVAVQSEFNPEADRRACMLEIQATLLRLAKRRPAHSGSCLKTGEGEPRNWQYVGSLMRFVSENYTRDLSVTEIARQVGLHPRYAMTLFAQTCGITLGDYQRKKRLLHAQRLLITTDAKIIDIAMDSGFMSVSAFYRAFAEDTKQSPEAFRNSLHPVGATPRNRGLIVPANAGTFRTEIDIKPRFLRQAAGR